MYFFGIEFFDKEDFWELVIRFFFNLTFILLIAKYLYYNATRRKDYLFTYILISVVVFMLCFLLDNVKLQLGFALGLFAIFGIIRYRTQQIPIKEMTYLFLVIGVSVVNALSNSKISYAELLFANIGLFAIAFVLEKTWHLKHESRKNIDYEKIELIKPENRALLIADIEERTGLKINRLEVGRIDFLRDTARIRIYYYEPDYGINTVDNYEQDFDE
jgi:cell division protein FtsW (lipid II flippase)